MGHTIVYGCDWCDEIVEKDRDGKPKYSMEITAQQLGSPPPLPPKKYKICGDCKKVYEAVSQGKFRR